MNRQVVRNSLFVGSDIRICWMVVLLLRVCIICGMLIMLLMNWCMVQFFIILKKNQQLVVLLRSSFQIIFLILCLWEMWVMNIVMSGVQEIYYSQQKMVQLWVKVLLLSGLVNRFICRKFWVVRLMVLMMLLVMNLVGLISNIINGSRNVFQLIILFRCCRLLLMLIYEFMQKILLESRIINVCMVKLFGSLVSVDRLWVKVVVVIISEMVNVLMVVIRNIRLIRWFQKFCGLMLVIVEMILERLRFLFFCMWK